MVPLVAAPALHTPSGRPRHAAPCCLAKCPWAYAAGGHSTQRRIVGFVGSPTPRQRPVHPGCMSVDAAPRSPDAAPDAEGGSPMPTVTRRLMHVATSARMVASGGRPRTATRPGSMRAAAQQASRLIQQQAHDQHTGLAALRFEMTPRRLHLADADEGNGGLQPAQLRRRCMLKGGSFALNPDAALAVEDEEHRNFQPNVLQPCIGRCKCGSLNWKEENNSKSTSGGQVWSHCCGNGKVIPGHPGLPTVPQPSWRTYLTWHPLPGNMLWHTARR
eukprot:360579-Chlamydomonas_euryale.AAC.2